ncbi:MAG TPA: chitobiase/beta-hexosaminidase C-terminal domain-containing protein [Verrucomicrobiae bacterium]|nr:chitobiase/beta-hexosaminidase C-terminal domain-containing protein [Verrucomicrobiae bacterium]
MKAIARVPFFTLLAKLSCFSVLTHFLQITISAQDCGLHFAPSAGYFETAQAVTIASEDPQAILRYTIDGNFPDEHSARIEVPIPINTSTIIHVRSWTPADPDGSCHQIAGYFIQTAPATFDPPTSATATNGMKIELRAASAGTTIKYSIHTNPPPNILTGGGSLIYSEPITLTAPAFTTLPSALIRISAVTTKDGLADGFAAANYYFRTVGAPSIEPTPHTDFESRPILVSISQSSDNEELLYTVDGSTPSIASPRYIGPFLVLPGTFVQTLGVKGGLVSRLSQALYPSKCTYYSKLAESNSGYQNAANYACIEPWLVSSSTPELPSFSVDAYVEKNRTVILWNAVAWADYEVQRSRNLTDWESFGSPLPGLNLVIGTIDTAEAGQNFFYRVLATKKVGGSVVAAP